MTAIRFHRLHRLGRGQEGVTRLGTGVLLAILVTASVLAYAVLSAGLFTSAPHIAEASPGPQPSVKPGASSPAAPTQDEPAPGPTPSPTPTPDWYDLLRPPPALEYSRRLAKDVSESVDVRRAIIVRYENGHVVRHKALGPVVLLPRGGFTELQWRDPTGAPRRLLVAARGIASIEVEQEP